MWRTKGRTDGRTDGRWHIARYSTYAVARWKPAKNDAERLLNPIRQVFDQTYGNVLHFIRTFSEIIAIISQVYIKSIEFHCFRSSQSRRRSTIHNDIVLKLGILPNKRTLASSNLKFLSSFRCLQQIKRVFFSDWLSTAHRVAMHPHLGGPTAPWRHARVAPISRTERGRQLTEAFPVAEREIWMAVKRFSTFYTRLYIQ